MAETAKAACPQCPRTDVSVVGGGVLRAHAANGKKITPENPACPGSAGAPRTGEPVTPGYVCRIPAGPTGCGHVVELTSNGRARSHLDNRNEGCPGGSDWPLKVDADGSRTDTAPVPGAGGTWLCGCEGVVWGSFGAMDDAGHGIGRCRDRVPVAPALDLPHDRTATSSAFISELEKAVGDLGTVLGQTASDMGECDCGRNWNSRSDMAAQGHGLKTCVSSMMDAAYLGVDDETVECACNLTWASSEAMRAAGHDDMDCESAPLVRPAGADEAEHGDMIFDVTHRHTDESGTEWIHPGEAAECRLPDCCTHSRGFVYGDDGKGHDGSVCPVCGADEPDPGTPEWRTPADLLAQMPEDVRRLAATDPDCWDCGHPVIPLVDRFGLDGAPEVITWACRDNCEHAARGEHYGAPCRPQPPGHARLRDVDEGDFFVRHGARPPMNVLVYRMDEHESAKTRAVTVVSAGPHQGRTGTLTNPMEEITCTDEQGRPEPRHGTRTPQPPSLPEPWAIPVTTSPAPGSKPSTTASAPAATTTTSSPATASGPTAGAASSTRTAPVTDAFSTPKQALREADKYDSYGRYKLAHPDTGKPVKWTRATTFAKSVQDTYALSMWSQRMTLKGAALRQDITAAVLTLDVKADKDRVNGLVEDAKKAAGDKVAANKGTAVHAFTEDRDRRLVGLPVKDREVPEEFTATVDAYAEILGAFGLEPVPGLIEFTTAVKQYEVAGTSDRVYRVTRDITVQLGSRTVTLYAGEYVIGDVKTGADLSYGWQEICIQLALYAQGLNTAGVWSWEHGTWGKPTLPGNPDVLLKVRTDVGLVPHLPVDRGTTGAPLATLYAVDLDAGWAAAVLCGQVRTWRKARKIATALEVADVAVDPGPDRLHPEPGDAPQRPVSRPVIISRPATLEDRAKAVTSRAEASAVFQEAKAARVTVKELNRLTGIMKAKLESFVEQGS